MKSGTASYVANTDTGELNYDASVTVGFLFVKKTQKASGKYTVDPRLLTPAALTKVGDQITLGQVTFTAEDIQPGTTKVGLTIQGQGLSGYAILDTSGQFIRVEYLFAQGKVGPLSLTIEADEVKAGFPVVSRKSFWSRFCEFLSGK